jgi:hypothetical protein
MMKWKAKHLYGESLWLVEEPDSPDPQLHGSVMIPGYDREICEFLPDATPEDIALATAAPELASALEQTLDLIGEYAGTLQQAQYEHKAGPSLPKTINEANSALAAAQPKKE